MPGVLPDFLIIGGMKCGTTSLYAWLAEHPSVRRTRKEIRYFSQRTRYAYGENWYRAHFPEHEPGRTWITGEGSPAYLFVPDAPERAAKLVPHAKLIALLRDPVERARSHWSHQFRRGIESEDLDSTMRRALRCETAGGRSPNLDGTPPDPRDRQDSHLARGRYAEQLERWLTYYDRDSLLVLDSAELFERPVPTLNRVLDFLGLPPYPKLPELTVHGSRTDSATMRPETRELLRDYFEPFNRQLYRLLRRDLGWDRPAPDRSAVGAE